ncbi:hypothetical protein ACFL7D_01670 [candidate division KSB1 bacterium]
MKRRYLLKFVLLIIFVGMIVNLQCMINPLIPVETSEELSPSAILLEYEYYSGWGMREKLKIYNNNIVTYECREINIQSELPRYLIDNLVNTFQNSDFNCMSGHYIAYGWADIPSFKISYNGNTVYVESESEGMQFISGILGKLNSIIKYMKENADGGKEYILKVSSIYSDDVMIP